jgi:GH24 family phage-related lysozyme (muramidase)
MATRGPRERTRTITRDATVDTSGLSRSLRSIGDFFGQQGTRLRAEETAQEIRRNEAAVAQLGDAVRADVPGAREAAKTGDYSKFIGVEMARRTMVQTAGAKVIGDRLADADKNTFRDGVLALPPTEDPEAFSQSFGSEQTKGMNPTVRHAYLAAVDKYKTKFIEQRRKGIENAQIVDMKAKAEPALRQQLQTEGIKTAVQYEQFIDRYAAAAPGVFTKNRVEFRDQFNRALVKEASRAGARGQRAQDLLVQTGVLSQMDSTEVAKLRATAITEQRQAFTAEHNVVIQKGLDSLTEWQLKGDGNLADLSARYLAAASGATKHGPYENAKFTQMRAKYTEEFQKNAEVFTAFRQFDRTGQWPGMTDQTKDLAVKYAYNRSPADGISLEATRGSSKANIQKRSALMATGGQGFTEALGQLMTIDKKSRMAMEGNHLEKGVPAMMYHALASIARNDPQGAVKAEQMLPVITEALKNDPKGAEGHFMRRFRTQSAISSRFQQGGRGELEFITDFLSELSDDDKALMGIPEDTRLDKFLTQDMYNNLVRKLDLASFISSAQPGDGPEKIKELLKASMKDEYEIAVDANGDGWAHPRRSPRVVQGFDGGVHAGRRFDEASVERVQAYKDQWVAQDPDRRAGVFASVEISPDKQTDVDGTRAMVDSVAGPIAYRVGPVLLTPEHAQLMHGLYVPQETHPDGSVTAVFVPPEGEDADQAMLSSNTIGTYDHRTQTWSLRYVDRPELQEMGTLASLLHGVSEFFGGDLDKEAAFKDLKSLDNAQREKAQRFLLKTDPQFWPDAKLQRMLSSRDLKLRKRIGEELTRRLPVEEGGEGGTVRTFERKGINPGIASAFPAGMQPVPSQEGMDMMDLIMQDHMNEGLIKGMYNAEQLNEISKFTGMTFAEKMAAADKGGMKASFFDDLSQPAGQQFLLSFSNFIEEREGFVAHAYDDAERGGPVWKPGKSKGEPTVGFGYNMNRPNAKEEMASVGLNRAEVLSGKKLVTRDQARALQRVVLDKLAVFFKRKFPDTPMEQHRWVALMSLAYNSRWDKNGPTLIGPKLTAAIKEERWEDAAHEIEFKSLGGVSKNQLPGITLRRALEATQFRGADHDVI